VASPITGRSLAALLIGLLAVRTTADVVAAVASAAVVTVETGKLHGQAQGDVVSFEDILARARSLTHRASSTHGVCWVPSSDALAWMTSPGCR
jgi:NAD(P)H-hydrate repair Nnr-like enzyme with NAD(P)H-hydrate dehydratase domain